MYNEDMFEELTDQELDSVDGGIGLLAGAIIGAVVCVGFDVGNEALKNKTGKDIGGWVTYGAGWAIDKAGQGISNFGKSLY